ncbi:2-hydroxy-3-oxopropionate reductase [Sanguibacter gelidistatuariae]|uniref:2-hydroxy-3-oxopropionate reductase n=1 Tax=Sanguibacter gelidistatuariae TaxID=1814289 RepID=A0A1G6V2C2_9MICO|nr:NAD(P)-dependent oxidoreductase [Sanguibacter gelidistatuariae]SDD47045.1 2-hydroxy-3-oxopropionate reductase [Sanguibacter gelidistatuariae]
MPAQTYEDLPCASPANDVGFIGLGVMGAPMAAHILASLANARLHVSARRPASAQPLVDAGAVWHPTARSLAAACRGARPTVVLMVPDLPDIEAVLDGPDGLLAGITRPTSIAICSTVSSAGVRALDVAVRARTGGLAHVVDAPVSGGEEGARAGTLSIMVGGSDDDAAQACAALAPAGTPVHLGPLGSGQIAKACNQMIVAATVLALGEASVIAERAGLDVAALLDLLGGGYAGSRVLEVKKRRFAEHDHSPSGAAKFMVKDLGSATDEAIRTGTATPQLDLLRAVFTDLTAAGLGDQDTAVVQAFIEDLPRSAPAPPGRSDD